VTTQSTDQGLDQPATNDATAQALVRAIPDPIFRIGVDGIYRGFKVDNERDLLTPAVVVELRAAVGAVWTWPVNDPPALADARRLGVTGVIGTDLDVLRGPPG